MSEREFEFYSKQNFGDEIQNLEGIYHPPKYCNVLARNAFGIPATAAIGFVASAAIPEAIAGAALAARLSPAVACTALSAGAGTAVTHFLGGDPFDARTKSLLWPRYEADFKRRQLR